MRKNKTNQENLNKNIKYHFNSNQIKTTDINILLNRVRLDKKKKLNKKIIISTILFFSLLATSFLLLK
jgi:hypothetical protein